MARPRTVEIDAEQVLAGVIRRHAELLESAAEWLEEAQAAAKANPKSFWARRDLVAAGHAVRIVNEQGVPTDPAGAILARDLSKYERAVTHRLIRELVAAGKLERTAGGVRPVLEVANG